MHVRCILKLNADNKEKALQVAQSYIESSIESATNTCGWDYAEECKLILIPCEDLEEHYNELRKQRIKEISNNIRSYLMGYLIKYLPLKEAPLLVDDYDINEDVERILKDENYKSIPLPDNFLDLIELMTKVVTELSQNEHIFQYHIKQINKIQDCINNPQDPKVCLQCTDNHFADLTKGTIGEKVFYVNTDRHV